MQLEILKPEIQAFIKEKSASVVTKLALMKNPFNTVNWQEILTQIESRQKSKDKLPTWFTSEGIIYPAKISIEQTSSEITAAYKASLISGSSIIDLTGGFGVDALYFSRSFGAVIHCEMNAELSAIAKHNFIQLQAKNIFCYAGNSESILQDIGLKHDWIYIDPSRRNDHKGKVFMLNDCLPNVPKLLDFYFTFSNKLLVKTAPILDISAGLKELKFVKKLHIVAVDNEVKELLWEIVNGYSAALEVNTINFKKNDVELFAFNWNSNSSEAFYGLTKKYLYEPNSAIMKSGAFNEIGRAFNLAKLHPNSHLYTSDDLIKFPGRVFMVSKLLPYQKNEMKANLVERKSNVTVRNFPNSVETIRKKWKIAEGGDLYSFFTTDINDSKIVLICTKI